MIIPEVLHLGPFKKYGFDAYVRVNEANRNDDGNRGAPYVDLNAPMSPGDRTRQNSIKWGWVLQSAAQAVNGLGPEIEINPDGRVADIPDSSGKGEPRVDWKCMNKKRADEFGVWYVLLSKTEAHPDWLFVCYAREGEKAYLVGYAYGQDFLDYGETPVSSLEFSPEDNISLETGYTTSSPIPGFGTPTKESE